MSDYSFWDKGFDAMVEEREKQKSSASKGRFPISYVGKSGTYIFRIYPEEYEGRARTERVVWTNQLHNYKRVINKPDDTRIDDLVKEAKERDLDSKTEGFWRHKKSKDVILMAYLISAPEDKYIQPAGTATALILTSKQFEQYQSFLMGLAEEGIKEKDFLNPTKPNHAIKMKIDRVQENNSTKVIINVSATTSADYDLPDMETVLPEGVEFTGLDDIFVKPDAVLTDELYAEFKQYYDDKVAKVLKFKGESTYSPEDKNAESGYVPEFSEDDADLKAALES